LSLVLAVPRWTSSEQLNAYCTLPQSSQLLNARHPPVAQEEFFWRLFWKHLLLGVKSEEDLRAVLARTVTQRQYTDLCGQMAVLLRTCVGPWVAAGGSGDAVLKGREGETVLRRLRMVEKVLAAAGAGAVAAIPLQ
jgi:hypothetical protein